MKKCPTRNQRSLGDAVADVDSIRYHARFCCWRGLQRRPDPIWANQLSMAHHLGLYGHSTTVCLCPSVLGSRKSSLVHEQRQIQEGILFSAKVPLEPTPGCERSLLHPQTNSHRIRNAEREISMERVLYSPTQSPCRSELVFRHVYAASE